MENGLFLKTPLFFKIFWRDVVRSFFVGIAFVMQWRTREFVVCVRI